MKLWAPAWQFVGLQHPGSSTAVAPPLGADFGPTLGSDFATSYAVVYDATVLMVGSDDGSSISSITNIYFGQAGTTHPWVFTGDQVHASSSLTFTQGSVVDTSPFTMAQPFNPVFANGYVCAFYTAPGGINYRVVLSPTALLTPPNLSARVALEVRWGSAAGFAVTQLAGGVTTYVDNGGNGDQSSVTNPAGTYTAVANELLFLEKIGVVP